MTESAARTTRIDAIGSSSDLLEPEPVFGSARAAIGVTVVLPEPALVVMDLTVAVWEPVPASRVAVPSGVVVWMTVAELIGVTVT
ncbi:MAG: hypothetical protein ACR2OU_19990, partial [Thermomicrobiales bacterium]